MLKSQFPAVIDNTLLKDWRDCHQKAFRKRVQGLHAVSGPSCDIIFGQAFAKAIETARRVYYHDGNDARTAIDAATSAASHIWTGEEPYVPTRSGKTYENLLDAIPYYFSVWPLGDEGNCTGIEAPFKVELPYRHPDTNEPLYFVGKPDAKFERDGVSFFVDEKTTGRLSDTWMKQWDMDTQTSGYIWSEGQQSCVNIRAIEVLKTSLNSMMVPVTRTSFQLNMWYDQMLNDVNGMLVAYEEGDWYKTGLGRACVSYGHHCEFAKMCNTPNPEMFASEYVVRFWNPTEIETETT